MYFNQVQSGELTEKGIKNFLGEYIGAPISVFDKITDYPKLWKHSCEPTGVTVLPPHRCIVYGIQPVDFVYCRLCGKVIYYVH